MKTFIELVDDGQELHLNGSNQSIEAIIHVINELKMSRATFHVIGKLGNSICRSIAIKILCEGGQSTQTNNSRMLRLLIMELLIRSGAELHSSIPYLTSPPSQSSTSTTAADGESSLSVSSMFAARQRRESGRRGSMIDSYTPEHAPHTVYQFWYLDDENLAQLLTTKNLLI